MKKIVFPLVLFISFSARADFAWETSLMYLSDSFKYSTTSSDAFSIWDTSFNFSIGKSKEFYFGWNVLGVSQTQDPGTGTQSAYASSEMGPRLMYTNAKGTFQTAISYHLKNTTTYNPGSSSATLTGTALLAEIGYLFEVSDGWRAGLKMNYYAPAFTQSLVGSTTFSQVSYSRTMIFPSAAFSYRW